jgi:hypothetical protein
VTAVRGRFERGVNLQVRRAEIGLEQSEFGAPSRVTGADEFGAIADPRNYRAATGLGSGFVRSRRLDETKLREKLREDPTRSERPRLLSLRRSDVGRVALTNVDLRACRFEGALNLDGLRSEHGNVLARTPATYPGFRRTGHRRGARAAEKAGRAACESLVSAGVRVTTPKRAARSLPHRHHSDLHR